MPKEIVARILRVPGNGVYAWEADEAASTLTLMERRTRGVHARPVSLDVGEKTTRLWTMILAPAHQVNDV